jgi:hypothetical protein
MMLEAMKALPWGHIGVGYLGLLFYLLTSIANPADESLSSLKDVFNRRGRTLLTAVLATPVLVVLAQYMDQLSVLSAFGAGYGNVSLLRKAVGYYESKTKIAGASNE